jgi:hypothetical protein
MSSSGMWRCVGLVLTDVSEERIASIFRVEKSASEDPVWPGGCRLEAILSSKTSVNFIQTTRRHTPEDSTLYWNMHL